MLRAVEYPSVKISRLAIDVSAAILPAPWSDSTPKPSSVPMIEMILLWKGPSRRHRARPRPHPPRRPARGGPDALGDDRAPRASTSLSVSQR